jgi:hypothetical protein
MADDGTIREIIERVVLEVLDVHVPALRDEIIDRVLEQLQPLLATPGGSPTDLLKNAVAGIQQGSSQTDILRALLDGAAQFAGRAALFVLRGNTAVGWQARGFRDNDTVKILSLDSGAGLAALALQQRCAVSGASAQFDPRFVAGFGVSADGSCLVLPLIIREKVAALLYADRGAPDEANRAVDAAALDLLIRTAGQWVELLALRKSAGLPPPQPAPAATVVAPVTPAATPVAPPPAASVPAPAAVAARAAAMPVAAAAAPALAPVVGSSLGANPAAAPAAPAPAAADEELHRKAKRFAKLLVDEIKLYNKAKLAEGKQNRDLYERLKDDIDKSRATYDKRYADTPVAAANYFTQELVRGLADNNPDLLGSSFPR